VATRAATADLLGRTGDVEGRYLAVLMHPELQMEPDVEMGWRVRGEAALDRLIERAAVANSLEEVERLLDA
jgi:hypothetical protein